MVDTFGKEPALNAEKFITDTIIYGRLILSLFQSREGEEIAKKMNHFANGLAARAKLDLVEIQKQADVAEKLLQYQLSYFLTHGEWPEEYLEPESEH
jgi:hypothetical protein